MPFRLSLDALSRLAFLVLPVLSGFLVLASLPSASASTFDVSGSLDTGDGSGPHVLSGHAALGTGGSWGSGTYEFDLDPTGILLDGAPLHTESYAGFRWEGLAPLLTNALIGPAVFLRVSSTEPRLDATIGFQLLLSSEVLASTDQTLTVRFLGVALGSPTGPVVGEADSTYADVLRFAATGPLTSRVIQFAINRSQQCFPFVGCVEPGLLLQTDTKTAVVGSRFDFAAVVPEPGTAVLLALGLGGLAAGGRARPSSRWPSRSVAHPRRVSRLLDRSGCPASRG
ncbi:MAG: PEP-CTERM sorting domain-containing protein [Myxococcota bacterium]